MRVVTWNINSVRLRIGQVKAMVERLLPDVLCLQETKVPDPLFPRDAIAEMGFPHLATSGMKGYNGVAIASRLPLSDIRAPHWCGREDCRHLIATVGGFELHNLYVPAGGDIPDADANPKFAHKLEFLDALTDWFSEQNRTRPMMAVGDFNIAPLETDVWSHKQLLGVVSHTPIEVARLAALQGSLSWVDAVRRFIPPSERLYTWWSYRSSDWAASNRGRRLDHVWVTPALAPNLLAAEAWRDSRDWPKPSDHIPVAVDLEMVG